VVLIGRNIEGYCGVNVSHRGCYLSNLIEHNNFVGLVAVDLLAWLAAAKLAQLGQVAWTKPLL